MLDFAAEILNMGLTSREKELVMKSQQAYLHQQTADRINDEEFDNIPSELDENYPEEWVRMNDPLQGDGKELPLRKIKAARRKRWRDFTWKIADGRLLRRCSKHVTSIINKFPNIGQDIEWFVKEQMRGAGQAYRTFDGNRKVGKKVTFSRVKEHLEKTYKRKFACGTVVQLCVARNQHRKSTQNYKGVANTPAGEPRKGFSLRYNPDAHWLSAFYKLLDTL